MSRSKSRPSIDVCADCGASDPSWASINRGILLCVQCCSVHRSMGRHISQVKSLRQGHWAPSLLAMIKALNAQNVNCLWEHSLLDPSSSRHLRRKPQSKDSLHPTKAEFIQAKHCRLAYVIRQRPDDAICTATELSRQLHSSVRSANLDTSFRLLVLGADPNYFNQEKGTSCLHVACRAGHATQAELLVAWGADPSTKDSANATPSQVARQAGHIDLANRMVELVYEVTDRLAYYLCNKKPDHTTGQHYINLEHFNNNEMTDGAKAARGKLQLLPNHLFEELVMDIYDEVDRRECEAVWNTSAVGLEKFGVAFLPVNPALSSPRNQGRQKLARLSPGEMAALLRDVLMDAMRRQHIATLKPHTNTSVSENDINRLNKLSRLSDDEPLYDSVASDDDYAALAPFIPKAKDNRDIHDSPKMADTAPRSYDNIPQSASTAIHKQQSLPAISNAELQENLSDMQKTREIEQMQLQLNCKDSVITELKFEIRELQKTVETLTNDNARLKSMLEKSNAAIISNSPPTRDVNILLNSPNHFKHTMERNHSKESEYSDTFDGMSLNRGNQRPTSMYETREGPKLNWQITKHQLTTIGGLDRNISQEPNNTIQLNTVPYSVLENDVVSCLPCSAEVHSYCEGVTKSIQELWAAMQDPATYGHSFVFKADKIKQAVHQLLQIFPQKCEDENVCSVLSELSISSETLLKACSQWGVTTDNTDDPMFFIRSAAYDLAKATKLLVTNFPINQSNQIS